MRDIRNFFKPFTIPRDRVPVSGVEDEIVVAAQQPSDAAAGVPRHRAALPTHTPQHERALRREPLPREAGSADRLAKKKPELMPRTRLSMDLCDGRSARDGERAHPASTASAASTVPAVSSFSSVSTSSQSSSRRVMKHGIPVVTNSDSESADDSDELADLDSFIPHKKMRMTPPGKDAAHAIQIPDTTRPEPKRQSARISNKSARKMQPQLPPSPPSTVYKHSLASMVKANQKRQKQEMRIAEAEAAVAAVEKKNEEQVLSVDGKVVAEMTAEDSDEGRRMMAAMARTEALEDDEKFYFFKDTAQPAQNDPFPDDALPDERWGGILKNGPARRDACLTGLVADLAAGDRLSPAIISWFARQLIHELQDDLREAYVEIIGMSALFERRIDTANLSTLRSFYCTTIQGADKKVTIEGAKPASPFNFPEEAEIRCLCGDNVHKGAGVSCNTCGTWQHATCYYTERDGGKAAKHLDHHCINCKPRTLDIAGAKQRPGKCRKQHFQPPGKTIAPKEKVPGLRYIVRVLQYCAPLAGIVGVGRALCELALANVDDNLTGNIGLRLVVQQAIAALSDSVEPENIDQLYNIVRRNLLTGDTLSPKLQCRIVAALPATSTNIHQLRRRLALYLITRSQKARPLTSGDWSLVIIKRLRASPEYTINEVTDYALLQELVEILDIAIDAGFSDFAFSAQMPTMPSATRASEAERAFNARVDALISHLQIMASRVRNTGATHLKRLEAKGALERLILRLEHGVRTTPKQKIGLFGGVSGQTKSFMEGFVTMLEEAPRRAAHVENQLDESADGLMKESDEGSAVHDTQMSNSCGDAQGVAATGVAATDGALSVAGT